MNGFTAAWWSAGVTSAVACKMALEMYPNVELYYIHIDSAHPDNERFKKECEEWYGKKIKTLKSSKFKDQFDCIEFSGMVNYPGRGAACTQFLKKDVRFDFENMHSLNLFNDETIINQVWGFEFEKKQINRAIRFGQQYPNTNPLFPLIEKGLDKDTCAGMLINAGILLPIMYRMGYSNNNCIGCVKGGMWYWNMIRIDFPEYFKRMAIYERKAGYSCINGVFLDELNPNAGRKSKEVMPSCGIICDVEFGDIPDKNLHEVIAGKKTIYEAINTVTRFQTKNIHII